MEQPEEERDGQLQLQSGHGQVRGGVGQQRVQRASEQGLHEGGHVHVHVHVGR